MKHHGIIRIKRLLIGLILITCLALVLVIGVLINPDTETNIIKTESPKKTVTIPPSSAELQPLQYPEHVVVATVFWVGEGASIANDNITNTITAWDENPVGRFGGVDEPNKRAGVLPFFTPKHNPFYFALPAAEYDSKGLIAGAREKSYWSNEKVDENKSLFKGRWIKVTVGTKTAYAQWLDVGPNEEQDYDYVFGGGKPKNTFDQKAGLDLSPAASETLGFNDGSQTVTWQFVEEKDVPSGLWKDYLLIDNETHW